MTLSSRDHRFIHLKSPFHSIISFGAIPVPSFYIGTILPIFVLDYGIRQAARVLQAIIIIIITEFPHASVLERESALAS